MQAHWQSPPPCADAAHPAHPTKQGSQRGKLDSDLTMAEKCTKEGSLADRPLVIEWDDQKCESVLSELANIAATDKFHDFFKKTHCPSTDQCRTVSPSRHRIASTKCSTSKAVGGLASSEPNESVGEIDPARWLYHVGNEYFAAGEYNCAMAAYARSVKQSHITTLGNNDPATVPSLLGMANVHTKRGEFDDALMTFERALDVLRRAYGNAYVGFPRANILNAMGMIHFRLGLLDEAIFKLTCALSAYKSELGEDHPTVGMTANNIANMHYCQGNMKEALKYYKVALAVWSNAGRDYLVKYSPSTLNNIGTVYLKKGRLNMAKAAHGNALKIVSMGKQEDNRIAMAQTLNKIGDVHIAAGNVERALEAHKAALCLIRSEWGDYHVGAVATLHRVGALYEERAEFGAALEMYENIWSIYTNGENRHHWNDDVRAVRAMQFITESLARLKRCNRK